MSVVVDHHTFTLEEYHRMIETGILTENDRVELINGEIINMSPINSPHAGRVKRTNALFTRLLGDQVIVSVQDPLTIQDASEPEPDVMLLEPRDDFYASAHPQPKDVYLLVEVADSSVRLDREVKLPVYARASVAEVWIIDLTEQRVEAYRSPLAGEYQEKTIFKPGENITIPHFLITVAVKDLLG